MKSTIDGLKFRLKFVFSINVFYFLVNSKKVNILLILLYGFKRSTEKPFS